MKGSFRCLAVETATRECSVAVSNGTEVVATGFADAGGSSRRIYQVISNLLSEAQLSLEQLDCVAFGCGPGSFTGVRIASSVAQGIAYARSIPVCRVSSLAAIVAAATSEHKGEKFAACLDARMDEAYLGLYSVAADEPPHLLEPDRLVDPATFSLAAVNGSVVAVGPGWDAFPEMLDRNRKFIGAVDTGVWPSAGEILTIAEHQFAMGDYVQAAEALPNYVRNKVTQ